MRRALVLFLMPLFVEGAYKLQPLTAGERRLLDAPGTP